jgi:hypothetical protein
LLNGAYPEIYHLRINPEVWNRNPMIKNPVKILTIMDSGFLPVAMLIIRKPINNNPISA